MGFRDLMTRAAVPKAGLGNLILPGRGGGKGKVTAGTGAVTYVSDGQPLNIDWNAEEMARNAYLGNLYVMRCVRLIAETVAALPWVAGDDPTNPSIFTKTAPLAQLLGPSTPQAPGGPNPQTSARVFWIWTICQYLISGRFGWECQLDGTGKNKQIVGLWPLVSAVLSPIPVLDGTKWFDGYQYTVANGGPRRMKDEQVVYAWRPSILDFRLPESVLQSAQVSVFIARSVDKYIANLLAHDLMATTLVVTPPFADADQRRAWQEQFHAQFSGVNKAGETIFGEVDMDEDDPPGTKPVQVEKLAMTVIEAGLSAAGETAKNEICLAYGVPRSLIGDASQRTYANAASEYKNFWTLTALDFIAEMQDHINTRLAPRLGQEVGWFDLSRVAALQPPSMFAPPAIADVITTGVATAAQIANVLGIPDANTTGDSDTYTVEIGEESSTPGPQGRGMDYLEKLEQRTDAEVFDLQVRRAQREGARASQLAIRSPEIMRWLEEADRRRKAPQNERTIRGYRKPWEPMERERIVTTRALSTRGAGIDQAREITQRVMDLRAVATASKLTKTVHKLLAKTYPESTLGWVDDADWSGPTQVGLSDIEMDRRPGGRDQAKVAGIAKSIAAGDTGAIAPVVLVKTPGSEKLKVADGYHRTLARKRINRQSVPAYVAHVQDDTGPWDRQMHDKKLNRSVEVLETRGFDEWIDEFGPSLEAEVGA